MGKTKEGHFSGGPLHKKVQVPPDVRLQRVRCKKVCPLHFQNGAQASTSALRLHGLQPSDVKKLLDEANARDYDPVFKEVGGLHDDPDREQSRVEGASTAVGKLRRAIRAVTACLDPGWNPTVFSFRRSQPGGDEQEPQQDYPASVIAAASKKTPGRVPASVVFALEEGTSLRGYASYFMTRDDTKARVVEIPVGYCIIFRRELIHNGMPYDRQNHRIHCYLSYRRLKWKPDVVNSVLSKHFTCQFCDVKLLESNAMRTYRRYCDKNHEAAKNQKTRRSTDNKVG
ncbi:hypothetical protein PC116_g857 [Phytophthora cactorum]|uniref:Uncharacterized protein n=1 Tax=Phytophthora cactorum TaxID=29920 RepID=A0A8T1A3V3_9STRA|nr:hypothetical protein Pcac1_g2619 [Phytophthora cactorum]KAG2840634.1 hypothetical protein PC112_g3671 [Phytophthora cactorum]KAG2842240.1 hypothetical protein PC111_g2796 [Phytophthora cactorum]KAG2869182.1 hypothetical protein PC113_g439 [Phytophthora cactorum]KAG3038277.1 hypothetical protein PC119_g3007 [Phytophthora cactorum]